MRRKLAAALASAGGEALDDGRWGWRGATIEVLVRPNGVAELVVRVDDPAAAEPVELLAANPATGWRWCLLGDGDVARRSVVAPAVWASAAALREALDQLVEARPAAGAAVGSEAVLEARTGALCGSVPPSLARAAALLMLARDGTGRTDTRHRLEVADGESTAEILEAELAGCDTDVLRTRAREEATVLEALARCPEAAAAVGMRWRCGAIRTPDGAE